MTKREWIKNIIEGRTDIPVAQHWGGFFNSQTRQQEVYLQKMVSLSRKYGRFILLDSGGVPETVTKTDFERIIELSRHLRGVENAKGCV